MLRSSNCYMTVVPLYSVTQHPRCEAFKDLVATQHYRKINVTYSSGTKLYPYSRNNLGHTRLSQSKSAQQQQNKCENTVAALSYKQAAACPQTTLKDKIFPSTATCGG